MRRLEAWNNASELVAPIVEQHGLERTSTGGGMFTNGTNVSTPVDQHIEHILNVAEWLLKEEDSQCLILELPNA